MRLNRRELLSGGAAAAALALLGPAGRALAAAGARPNILWLVSEDNNPYLGCYGDRLARTPNIDALAADGVRFASSFSEAPVCAPSRFALITGMHAESCGPAEHMRAAGHIPPWLRGFPALLRDAGYYTVNSSKTDYNAPIPAGSWDQSGPLAHWATRPQGAPFFAQFNFDICHETSTFVPIPGRTSQAAVRVPPYLPDTEQVRRDRAHYYDAMQLMDALVGERLAELEVAGLADDTIVIYLSDNGGPLPRSKRFCFDSGHHTPLIMRFPERWRHLAPARPGSVVETPVSGVDLPPFVLSLAGVPRPEYMQGVAIGRRRYAFGMRNRMDERYDMQRSARDARFRYVRNYMPHLPYGQHVVFMWGQAGYRDWEQAHLDGRLDEVQERFWHEKPAEELYDLRTDPDEVRNLASDPEHRGVLARMRAAVDAHLVDLHDNGFIPEGSPLEGYDASRRPGAYPLGEAMALAGRAIRRERSNLPELTGRLDDPNEVLRFWGALGCSMLGERAAAAGPALERRMSSDDSSQVRVAAAEALARLGATERSVPFLASTLTDHPDPRVRLQAANALENIGERARPALPALLAAQRDVSPADPFDQYVSQATRYTARKLTGTYVPSP